MARLIAYIMVPGYSLTDGQAPQNRPQTDTFTRCTTRDLSNYHVNPNNGEPNRTTFKRNGRWVYTVDFRNN